MSAILFGSWLDGMRLDQVPAEILVDGTDDPRNPGATVDRQKSDLPEASDRRSLTANG